MITFGGADDVVFFMGYNIMGTDFIFSVLVSFEWLWLWSDAEGREI